jgi:hypothetical protein
MNFITNMVFKTRDVLALLVLLVVYHGYEVLCYFMSNRFIYTLAVAICAAALFLVSTGLVYLHDFFQARYGWDALKLQYLNSLREDEPIPPYRVFKRLTRLVLSEGFWAVFVVGPVILGPFVITMLLRQRKTWWANLLYVVCGALFSSLFWVAFMRGLGVFTWKYIGVLGGS